MLQGYEYIFRKIVVKKDKHMHICGAVQNYLFKSTASWHIVLALLVCV